MRKLEKFIGMLHDRYTLVTGKLYGKLLRPALVNGTEANMKIQERSLDVNGTRLMS